MLDDLERILVQLYDTSAKARHVVDRANIPAERIDLDGAMRDVWHSIIAEATRRRQLIDLVRVAAEDYPQRVELQQFFGVLRYGRKTNDEEQMSDRWGGFGDVARLGERITVLETRLPLFQAEIERRFDQLVEGQNANRVHTDAKFNEVMTLIKASPVKPQNDRLFILIVVIGALVTAILLLVIAYWVYALTGGRLT